MYLASERGKELNFTFCAITFSVLGEPPPLLFSAIPLERSSFLVCVRRDEEERRTKGPPQPNPIGIRFRLKSASKFIFPFHFAGQSPFQPFAMHSRTIFQTRKSPSDVRTSRPSRRSRSQYARSGFLPPSSSSSLFWLCGGIGDKSP